MESLRQPALSISLGEARTLVEQIERDGGIEMDSGQDTLLLRFFQHSHEPEALELARRFEQALARKGPDSIADQS